MKSYMKVMLPGVAMLIGGIMLTGCHTVQGTLYGAGQDIRTVTGPAHSHTHHHRAHHHTMTVHKTTTTTTTHTTVHKTKEQPAN